jgi:hypothetical protein
MAKNDLKKITSLFFTSRVRLKIMKLFFTHPKNEYHMREISRLVDEQINAVRRELMSMENMEFLLTRIDGIKKFFSLNPEFPLYNELRSIIMKSNSLGFEIFKAKKDLGYVKFAVLSHTYLSSEKSDQNNIDLLIVGEPNLQVLEDCVKSAQEQELKEIFYAVITEADFDIRKKRRDPLVYSLMVLPRGMVVGRDEEFVI